MRLVTSIGREVPLLSDDWRPDINEIAWSLSQLRPYGGHGRPYSYAQHSVLVSYLVPRHFAFAGLMHDAHLPYSGNLSDAQREAVNHVTGGQWMEWEVRFVKKIRDTFRIPHNLPTEILDANQRATEYELGAMFGKDSQDTWGRVGFKVRRGRVPWPLGKLESWGPGKAYEEFMKRYLEVGSG